jgi:hypothetical protein
MTSLAGEFQTEVPLEDTLVACAEAIESLGWQVETVEPHRIVAYANTAATPHPPTIEIELDGSGETTDVRIIGTHSDDDPLPQAELIAELDRIRDAIKAEAEKFEDAAQDPPAGFYPDPGDSGQLRYWDGRNWTEQIRPGPGEIPAQSVPDAQPSPERAVTSAAQPERKRRGIRPHWRKMTWAIIVWSAIFAIWIVAALVTANPAGNCVHHAYITKSTCETASNAGTGIGVAALWFVWFFGFIVLSLIWFMTRAKGRECPACGERVKKGRTTCPACGHDFAAAAA